MHDGPIPDFEEGGVCLPGSKDDYPVSPPYFESTGDDEVSLTPGGKRAIRNLGEFKDVPAAEAVRNRGGGRASQVNQIPTDLKQTSVGEIANRAAKGDQDADTALKIIKQASKKRQKYGGK
ncbi:MAG: hypothetical protein ACFB12_02825 [Leptolyngbyaceae cyanobacterium]